MRFLSIRIHLLSLVACAVISAGSTSAAQSAPASSEVKPQSDTSATGSDTAKKPLTEKERKERERAFKKEVGKAYKDWLDQDVRWIISDEELQAFKMLGTDEERDQFIEQFWLRRDPTPDTVENEFKEEHYRRIAYANEHFPSGVPGSRTDRGRIYIAWGPPDEIESHPSGGTYNREISEGGGTTSTYPFEKWRYRYLEGVGEQVILEFVDQCMCSNYKLSMDPNDKDALLNVPGAGMTMYEEMGVANKADRITGMGSLGPFDTNSGTRRFDALELQKKINSAPPIKFKDLEEVVSHHISYNMMPFDVRTDFVRVTSDTVLVPVTIQMKNKDITFVGKDGIQTGTVNIFGRVTTITGRVAQTFEDTVSQQVPQDLMARQIEQQSIYWKALPLRPGMYKLDIVLKDVNGDRRGTLTRSIRVPQFAEEKLATSSLILADVMERVAAKNIGAGNFVIGNTKVRPRVEPADGKPATFKKNQKLNFWMQVYNLSMDEKTKKPSATVEYELVNAQTNKSVFKQTETTDTMGNVGEQITLEKSMPLTSLDPGLYRITIKVDDNISKQTINPSARFMVE
jgi:GWxTD domain-containing protein